MNRYEILKSLLDQEQVFKIICGAGNEDIDQVKRLSYIYTLAGATIIDVSANVDVVKVAIEGIELAYTNASLYDITIKTRPYIMVSVGMPGDPHVRKAYIDTNSCEECGKCLSICPTQAIDTKCLVSWGTDYMVDTKLCIGCGKCSNICNTDSVISYRYDDRKLLKENLLQCLESGAELIELHAAIGEHRDSLLEWELINSINPNNFNSLCLDRINLDNVNLKYRIEEARKISGDKLIIQADGIPMSGGENTFNSTLQTVTMADIINKEFDNNIYLILSGGTNSLTKSLAQDMGVHFNGVAIGSYARKIIKGCVDDTAIYIATDLVESNIDKHLIWDTKTTMTDKNSGLINLF
jgi:Fe-S-cluster-containing hydrogenase component 2